MKECLDCPKDISGRHHSAKRCVECAYINILKSMKKWREDNKEFVLIDDRIRGKIYRDNNPEKMKEKGRKWRKNNPEKNRRNRKRYREKHIEKEREKEKIQSRNYRKKYPEKIKNLNIINRHLRRALGKIPKDWYEKQLIKQEYKCGNIYCSCDLTKLIIGDVWVEHLIPVSRGGTNDLKNLELWCSFCNNSKHDKTLEEYYKEKVNNFIRNQYDNNKNPT